MSKPEPGDFPRQPSTLISQFIFPGSLSETYRLELNSKNQILSLVNIPSSHILVQEQFTKTEWTILTTILTSHPHYAPYEHLLASITSLSISECRTRIHQAQEAGPEALKRELKPVHRALSGIRGKLKNFAPYLTISVVRDLGYTLTTPSE